MLTIVTDSPSEVKSRNIPSVISSNYFYFANCEKPWTKNVRLFRQIEHEEYPSFTFVEIKVENKIANSSLLFWIKLLRPNCQLDNNSLNLQGILAICNSRPFNYKATNDLTQEIYKKEKNWFKMC